MDLGLIVLSDVIQTERPVSYGAAHTWNLKKNDTNELTYRTNSQAWRMNLRLLGRRVEWG